MEVLSKEQERVLILGFIKGCGKLTYPVKNISYLEVGDIAIKKIDLYYNTCYIAKRNYGIDVFTISGKYIINYDINKYNIDYVFLILRGLLSDHEL